VKKATIKKQSNELICGITMQTPKNPCILPLSSILVDYPVQSAVVAVVTDQIQYLEELRWLFISEEKPEI
jgi:hypothetical protein